VEIKGEVASEKQLKNRTDGRGGTVAPTQQTSGEDLPKGAMIGEDSRGRWKKERRKRNEGRSSRPST